MTVPATQRIGAWAVAFALVGLAALGAIAPAVSAVSSRLEELTTLRSRVAEVAARRGGEPDMAASVARARADLQRAGILPVPDGKPEPACDGSLASQLNRIGLRARSSGVTAVSRKDRVVECAIDVQAPATAASLPGVLIALHATPAPVVVHRLDLVRTEEDPSQFLLRLRGTLTLFMERARVP